MGNDASDERAFARAKSGYERLGEAEGADVSAAGRSRLLEHGRTTERAYVLLHGLTASPSQFAEFAAALHATGANVFVPRLPRHGHADRLTRVLAGLTAAELTTWAYEVVAAAQGLGRHLTVVGFSAGGLLGAWIAQHIAVDRVVCIAPLLGVGRVPMRLGRSIASAMLRAPNAFVWWHPVEREHHGPPHGYPRFATHAVAHAWRLGVDVLATARTRAPATRDIVLVSNASETTVNNRATAHLADAWTAHAAGRVAVRHLVGLPPSHDIIEPLRRHPLAAAVYPQLLEIVTAPHVLAPLTET